MASVQARRVGVIGTAMAILRHADAVRDAVLDDAARVIAVCSGPAAVGAQVRSNLSLLIVVCEAVQCEIPVSTFALHHFSEPGVLFCCHVFGRNGRCNMAPSMYG